MLLSQSSQSSSPLGRHFLDSGIGQALQLSFARLTRSAGPGARGGRRRLLGRQRGLRQEYSVTAAYSLLRHELPHVKLCDISIKLSLLKEQIAPKKNIYFVAQNGSLLRPLIVPSQPLRCSRPSSATPRASTSIVSGSALTTAGRPHTRPQRRSLRSAPNHLFPQHIQYILHVRNHQKYKQK